MSVQRTEASERCGLLGNYWLKADGESLILKDPKMKKNLLVWPYKLLRRYGRDRVSSHFISLTEYGGQFNYSTTVWAISLIHLYLAFFTKFTDTRTLQRVYKCK